MGGSAKESQLGASLAAEVLRDQRHVAEIFKLGNPQAKMDYLETQKKLLLVSKIVDKRSLAQVEEENLNLKTVEELNITTGTALFADLEAVYNPNEVSQYTIGQHRQY
jgi:hypothetical protein